MLWWSLGTDPSSYYAAMPETEWELFVQHARDELAAPLLTAGVLAFSVGMVLQAVRPPR
jgi:hypothetical protein